MTRYLKPVYAAEPVAIGDCRRRGRYSESDHGKWRGNWRESSWFRRYLRRYLCLQSQDPRPPMASRSGAQGRLRPEHRKRRGSSAVPARENRYGEQPTVRGQGWQVRTLVSVRELWVSAGRLRRRHVYAAETPAYQALSADDFR